MIAKQRGLKTKLDLNVDIAPVFAPLWRPAQYKGVWGGRGSGKSHDRALNAVIRAVAGKTKIVCIREIQKSTRESIKALIEAKIERHGIGHLFEIQDQIIKGANGSLFLFQGMQDHTADSIKSLEDVDIALIEEAQNLSARSWRLLGPTIRKSGSETWAIWNPRHEEDPVDRFFRGETLHPNAVVVKANWGDNPWFTDELESNRLHDQVANEDEYPNTWDGEYELVTVGAYYTKEMLKVDEDGRIGVFPALEGIPIKTAWDIGVDDYSAVWFFQEVSKTKVHVIGYCEFQDVGADHIVKVGIDGDKDCNDPDLPCRTYQNDPRRHWNYRMHHLPHDVKVREWGGGAKTRERTLRDLGVSPIRRGAMQGPVERINATRRLLPICYFNDTPDVQLGIKRLRRYKKKINKQSGQYEGPLKDGNDHGADAFGEYAVNSPILPVVEKPTPAKKPKDYVSTQSQKGPSWAV